MKKIAVTIPTYWSWETTKENLPEDAVFDHPTPLNLEGTLNTTLNSLKGLAGGSFYVILITAPVNPRISGQAEEKIEKIIALFIFQKCQGKWCIKEISDNLENDVKEPGNLYVLLRVVDEIWGKIREKHKVMGNIQEKHKDRKSVV